MNNIYLTIFFSFTLFFYCSGQNNNVEFSIYGNINKANTAKNNFVDEYESFSLNTINDSTLLRSYVNNRAEYKSTYTPKLRFSIGGSVKFEIKKRFAINTGLGLEGFALNFTNDFNFEQTVISSEEIEGVPNAGVYVTDFCDFYVVSIYEVEKPRKDQDQSILYLTIPINASYAIIQDKLNIHFGLLFQTPIISNLYREELSIHRESVEEGISCTWELNKINDNSGNSINNIFLNIDASVNYYITKNIGLQFGLKNSINNLFVEEVYQRHPYSIENYKPSRIYTGVTYKFNQKAKAKNIENKTKRKSKKKKKKRKRKHRF